MFCIFRPSVFLIKKKRKETIKSFGNLSKIEEGTKKIIAFEQFLFGYDFFYKIY